MTFFISCTTVASDGKALNLLLVYTVILTALFLILTQLRVTLLGTLCGLVDNSTQLVPTRRRVGFQPGPQTR